ncbi:unnamed protein product [Urochloa decumbens]|uniref:At1g61320/AtMIF1 LRR domain-containing protein n=1 Tax=Urochloa decumbens TaxID=240449 RepID=A0ABC9B8H9_9POAL
MDMMTNSPTSQETGHGDHPKPTNNSNNRPSARFCHLHPDILYRIASRLPPKEFARTSILSSDWRWSACPRLTFDAAAICKCPREDLHKLDHFRRYINEVNGVLQKHQDKLVETLEVKVDFVDSILLARHIDAWVHFAAASRTKSLTLDLKPERFRQYKGHLYEFPFQLLDQGSISRLQHMQLSFVSLNPPSCFKGFPNLRKLRLQALRVSRKDLENMLSHCPTLEWLYIDRCHLDDALIMVDTPLSRLLYLRVDCCKLTKIKFNVVNLATFEYNGSFVPIDLVHSFKLKSANIEFDDEVVFPHMLASLLGGLPGLQNLTFKTCSLYLEKPWSWDNRLKFSNLRHLQLLMFIWPEDVDKVLYSVSFLRVTPFIEKLEVHFCGSGLWLAESSPCRKDIGHCKYSYLKDIWITGFKAARGQLEFLMLVVENAPALEVLLVEIGEYPPASCLYGAPRPRNNEKAKTIVRTCLSTVLPQNVRFDVKE